MWPYLSVKAKVVGPARLEKPGPFPVVSARVAAVVTGVGYLAFVSRVVVFTVAAAHHAVL